MAIREGHRDPGAPAEEEALLHLPGEKGAVAPSQPSPKAPLGAGSHHCVRTRVGTPARARAQAVLSRLIPKIEMGS